VFDEFYFIYVNLILISSVKKIFVYDRIKEEKRNSREINPDF
jgi:hypothetical protein